MGAYYRHRSPLQRHQLLLPAVLVLLVIVGAAAAVAKGAGRNVITHIKGFEGPLPFHLETG